jgi:hypothetical protein
MILTAPEKLMQKLIHLTTGERYDSPDEIRSHFHQVDSEVLSDFRSGEEATGLPGDWSRHYESKGVAAEMLDGSYVGWTYWYGGGKHGEPYLMPWVDDAYDVEVVEVQKVVREFKKK